MENEKIVLEQVLPSDIEKRSFEIITNELEERGYQPRPYEEFVPPNWFDRDVTFTGEFQNSRLSKGPLPG